MNGNERLKKFYEMHPEKKNDDIPCQECGGHYKYYCKTAHMRSKKHEYGIMKKKLELLEKKNI